MRRYITRSDGVTQILPYRVQDQPSFEVGVTEVPDARAMPMALHRGYLLQHGEEAATFLVGALEERDGSDKRAYVFHVPKGEKYPYWVRVAVDHLRKLEEWEVRDVKLPGSEVAWVLRRVPPKIQKTKAKLKALRRERAGK